MDMNVNEHEKFPTQHSDAKQSKRMALQCCSTRHSHIAVPHVTVTVGTLNFELYWYLKVFKHIQDMLHETSNNNKEYKILLKLRYICIWHKLQ